MAKPVINGQGRKQFPSTGRWQATWHQAGMCLLLQGWQWITGNSNLIYHNLPAASTSCAFHFILSRWKIFRSSLYSYYTVFRALWLVLEVENHWAAFILLWLSKYSSLQSQREANSPHSILLFQRPRPYARKRAFLHSTPCSKSGHILMCFLFELCLSWKIFFSEAADYFFFMVGWRNTCLLHHVPNILQTLIPVNLESFYSLWSQLTSWSNWAGDPFLDLNAFAQLLVFTTVANCLPFLLAFSLSQV